MEAEQLSQVVEAIETLASDAGGLDKKPNVADVESLVGFAVTAADRDEAWAIYQGGAEGEQDDASADEPTPEVTPAPTSVAGTTRVTNQYTSPIAINGVTIEPGASGEVPRFDRRHAVMRVWLKAGVIAA